MAALSDETRFASRTLSTRARCLAALDPERARQAQNG